MLTEKAREYRKDHSRLHAGRLDKAYTLIRDMEYEYNADIGLAYASPVRGVWNIVHLGTLVPEGHQIYVCPTSCLRGVVLTTAEMGAMDKLSTITVGEDNILEGDMEEMLLEGTEQIIRELPEKPRMMMIFTSCIHHFMAVNYRRVYKILERKYPEIDFIDCYMDPIMRRTAPVIPSLWRQMHRVLKPSDQKDPVQVNLIGNCFPHTGENCDLTALLKEKKIRYMELNSCGSYDEFLTMSRSACNFYFHNHALKTVKDLEIRLGQPWMRLRPGYSYEEYEEDIKGAASLLGLDPPDQELCTQLRKETEDSVSRTLDLLGNTPVSIDYTAVDCPLELALYLSDHGFVVESVFIDVFTEREEIFNLLRETLPDLKIYKTAGWNIRQMERDHEGKVLCIGQKSAYFHNSDYFVNLVENAGLYGYRGIQALMEMIREAFTEKKTMRDLVQIKGWGCSCS